MAAVPVALQAPPASARDDAIVGVRFGASEEAAAAIERLRRVVAQERAFGLLVEGCADLHQLRRMLRDAPRARASLRRMRPALGTWCVGAAHVVEDVPDLLWPAEVTWGCRVTAVHDRDEALAWLAARRGA